MFRHRPIRSIALGIATLVVAGTASVLGSAAANAAQIGTLSFSPASGNDASTISISTSGACPSTATNVVVDLAGPGFPAGFVAVGNSSESLYGGAGNALSIPLSQTMATYAQQAGTTLQSGTYTFTVTCRTAFNATSLGDYVGSVTGTLNGTAWTYAPASTGPTATTTTLAASPASPVTAGTSVTFTATEAPAAAGSVQFMDGTTALGSPVAVNASGVATFSTSTLAAGTHSVTAAFTPTNTTAFSGSTSAAVSYVVNAAGPTATTTALAVSPANTAVQGSAVTLSATETPVAAGSVQFMDGTTALGSPVAVDTTGAASFTTATLTLGAHSLTAVFTPTNTTAFSGSTSPAVSFTITATAAASASEQIQTTVVGGTLTISVANNATVVLPTPVLDTAGDLFQTSGSINPVTVTDTRAGNPGFTVSGQVSDFSDGASHSINGENLGWTPSVVDNSTAQTVTAGAVVAPANGVAPTDAGTLGLKAAQTLAKGTGLGTSHVTAKVALNVPTSTVAGTYTATLTLTAI